MWDQANGDTVTMLDALQANILESHVRRQMAVLFVAFDDAEAGCMCLRDVVDLQVAVGDRPRRAPLMKSASEHHQERQPGSPEPERTYVGLGLSFSGYTALGIHSDHVPPDVAFRTGMRSCRELLGDPPAADWESPYDQKIHGVVLISARSADDVLTAVEGISGQLKDRAQVLGRQNGALIKENGNVVENFGFQDGISGPRFVETADVGPAPGADEWDPRLPLNRVLVPDPGAVDHPDTDPNVHHGSYLVYRKLEQDVTGFRAACTGLARSLNPQLDGPELEDLATDVQAWLIGRQKDGTPLVPGGAPGDGPNSFTYLNDATALHCPFLAHVRKVNPRGSNDRKSDTLRLMARRGITYDDGGSVGLLFMAVNANLGEQFEFVQKSWANDRNSPQSFGRNSGGMDQIIGQGDRGQITLFQGLAGPRGEVVAPVPPPVTMRGGEYFFLPSLATLRRLPELRRR